MIRYPFQLVEYDEQGQLIAQVIDGGLRQHTLVDRFQTLFEFGGLFHHALCGLGVTLVEGIAGLFEDHLGLAGDQLQCVQQGAAGRAGHIDRLSADGDGIITDAFQRDIGPDDRGDQPQMPGAGQVYRDEAMAEAVDLTHSAVDRVVVEHRGISQFGIACLQGMDRLTEGCLNQFGLIINLLADVFQITFQSGF